MTNWLIARSYLTALAAAVWIGVMFALLLLAVAGIAGCGGNGAILAPSAPIPALPPAALPLVLSGQSNALPDHLGDPLTARYLPGVTVVAKGATGIHAWDVDGELWPALDATLHQPLRAFVWWQGETDAIQGSQVYEADLRRLLTRVRAANGNPLLPVVVVRIIPYTPPAPLPDTSAVRAAQEAYVRSDPHATLINVDDLPNDGGNHVTAYGDAAVRVLAVIQ